MILIAHILIALTSMLYTTYVWFRPSRTALRLAGGLVVATLASGTYLVISTGSPILSSCISGLLYLAAISAAISSARRRLHQSQDM